MTLFIIINCLLYFLRVSYRSLVWVDVRQLNVHNFCLLSQMVLKQQFLDNLEVHFWF